MCTKWYSNSGTYAYDPDLLDELLYASDPVLASDRLMDLDSAPAFLEIRVDNSMVYVLKKKHIWTEVKQS